MSGLLWLFNSWQFYLILFFIFSLLFNQFYFLAAQKARKDGATTIILQLIASTTLLLLIPLYQLTLPRDYRLYLFLFLAIIFYTINDRLQTGARRNLPVSSISIYNQSLKVFLIIYGLVIFREPLVMSKTVGAGLIIAGTILLLYRSGGIKFNKYIIFSFLASLALASALIIDVDVSKNFNIPFYLAVTFTGPAILIKLFEKISVSDLIYEVKSQRKKYYLITGVSWGLLYFLNVRSLQLGGVTTVAPLQALTVLFNVIAAYLLLGERERITRKLIAAIIVIAGVMLIV